MEIFSSYNLIIEVSLVLILSFIFNGIAKKTNIPAVLMLIILGIIIQYAIKAFGAGSFDFFPMLEILGIVGLIMIVLEAALELKLKKEKLVPILKSLGIALIGLVASAYIAAVILKALIDGMTWQSALLYATPLSILSSAIIIPSVAGLSEAKKEFHVYESTFSDILGIMMFYFLTGKLNPAEDAGVSGFAFNLIITIIISLIASYGIILIFQKIKSQVKLFLLIAVLLLLYGVGKKMHLSSLIIILIFGLVIANMKLFFQWKLEGLLDFEKAKTIYHELHVITAETAFVVRTLFFVIFGITITLSSLLNLKVALISILIIISIYLIRYVLLRLFVGKDISPQLFIAPRGLITVLLFYAIPAEAMIPGFEPGILLFVIIGTSLIMTGGMIRDNRVKAVALTPEEIEEAADAEVAYIMNTTTDLSEIEDSSEEEDDDEIYE
ncbi:cation:proton antiporter [Aquimarina sp. MMG015]|uniref:cation:proton antiporter domain-containing protein n=1 Tax=Aquimarina TaxID=290174 RepID=UPI0004234F05|nr:MULTISPECIES: cation:proton antiporter [Aquimarina]AXT55265.1 sodium:proton exchanger [Aquimarina sp. AD1]MBQ4802231.1 cation:proton antiporter [Aquimarina sp. MMG015]RKN08269.1 sodium:proton exchanger [Aquimarina sp. AD1]